MATVEGNRKFWAEYDWARDGDEWSDFYGSPAAQWARVIQPRIEGYNHGCVLDLACGHGRWTPFLTHGKRYIGVDVVASCIEACHLRYPDAKFFVNDGRSLPMIADASIDFAFSFDSLVHCDCSTMSAYVVELERVLKPGGVAWLHHSNLHDCVCERNQEGRDRSMDAARMHLYASDAGLLVVRQEKIPWGASLGLIDCFTTLIKPNIFENPGFRHE
jgi:SAM-dependent methyltransferase